MRRRPFSTGLVLAVMQFVLFTWPVFLHAQSLTPAERETVIAEIKEYAERHTKNSGSMQTQVVLDLFRDNAAGLPPQEVARIYEQEYSRIKEASKPGPWTPLLPQAGWLVAFLLMGLLIFRDLLKDWLTRFFRAASEKIYAKLAGRPFFWGAARKHYREALRTKYAKLSLPFRPNRPLDMRKIYVPLKMKGMTDAEQVEAYSLSSTRHRSMITGEPGSGKSMLLKHLALSYAEGQMDGRYYHPVPVLLRLHRLNDPKATLEEQLVAELSRNDFPSAKRFVSSALEQGTLMLLLDGLDEVNSGERQRVVQDIKDSLEKYKHCRAIITCRSAIYRGEFDDVVNETLAIVEFSDQQLRRFLGSWERDMNARGKSIEQLVRTLHDRPLILRMARNPLLLTIISYLYTDTEFVLPNSRAEFYWKSTDILLDLWQQEYNRFKASDKRFLLQHLALFNQDATTQQGQDRLSMKRPTVLAQVLKLLPELNLKPENADPILDEIVQRSGLLLLIDGGESYQFAHLTLQEYLAATKLFDDGKGLIERFKKDPDTWRETVKLWCGLDRDSTELIRTINQDDPLTAFECLAEAQRVEPGLANGILEASKARLSTTGGDNAIVKAFGAIAADKCPRGENAFQMLKELLATAREPTCRIAVANALSLTNRPDAAQVLVDYYPDLTEIRSALIRMGDLAVPAFSPLIERWPAEVMNDLLAIGTPLAAETFVPCLWHADKNISFRAAWRLTALLPKPGVEDSIRHHPLTPQQRGADFIDWVWQPFNEPEDSALPIIAGRVVFLLAQAPVALAPATPQVLDQRVVVPLCAILTRRTHGLTMTVDYWTGHSSTRRIRRWMDIAHRDMLDYFYQSYSPHRAASSVGLWTKKEASTSDIEATLTMWNDPDPLSTDLRFLLKGLPSKAQMRFLSMIMERVFPTESDWRNVFRPFAYEFNSGWHYRTIIGITLLLSGAAVVHAALIIFHSPEFFSWKNGLLVIAAAFTSLFWMALPRYARPLSDARDFWECGLVAPFRTLAKAIRKFLSPHIKTPQDYFDRGPSNGEVALSLGWLPATGYLMTAAMLTYLPWRQVVLVWGLLLGVGAVLWRVGRRRERKARNSLRGIIEPPSASTLGVRRNGRGRFRKARFFHRKLRSRIRAGRAIPAS